MDDDDFFSAFEELQESTAKAEAIHRALSSEAPDRLLETVSRTSTHSTDSAASGSSDVEIIEQPTHPLPTRNIHSPGPPLGSTPISRLNLVTNADGSRTITLASGTDAQALLGGLRPSAPTKISVIPNRLQTAQAQNAVIRPGQQMVNMNPSLNAPTTNGSVLQNLLKSPSSTVNGSAAVPTAVMVNSPAAIRSARPNLAFNSMASRSSSPHQHQMINNARLPINAVNQQNAAINNARHSINTAAQESAQKALAAEAQQEELEELGHHGETFADYHPKKLKLGRKHPDVVVESASLSSVEPPEVTYQHHIPEHVIEAGYLSALQLESIIYASMQHEQFLPDGTRAGFLIGDGAGVGKGRTLAGIVYENWRHGRKRAVWLSVSNDLRLDAVRDLRDIGAGKISVHPLSKFKYGKLSSEENGKVKKGVIFATYSSLIGESHTPGKWDTRLKQLLKWCGKDFDGPILFDECHKAKNLCPAGSAKPTKTGLAVLELQNKLPNARVVYSSATGATEPKNMAYMTRLGLWGKGTTFNDFNDFIQAVERRGVCAMELVAMDMKMRGRYIARQLSFSGVSFRIREVPMDPLFKSKVYDQSVKLWVLARESFQEASDLLDLDQRTRKTMWGQFWSSHQRFFKYLCIAAKVPHVVAVTRDSIKDGSKCVVIGLQSTGEARTMEMLEDCGGELQEFVSTCKGVFQSLVDKHFPVPNKQRTKKIDLIGELLSSQTSSPLSFKPSSPVPGAGDKRKFSEDTGNPVSKRQKQDSEESEVSSSSSDDEDDDDSNENKSDSDSENDDYNPFAGFGSDGDSDDSGDWLGIGGRNKKKAKKKKSKSKEAQKAAAKKKKLEEKAKKKAERKENKKKMKESEKSSCNGIDGADSDEDIDSLPVPPPTSAKLTSLSEIEKAEKAYNLKQALLDRLEALSDRLPLNTLDELIDQLGGPNYVAELTGRKGRVISTSDGSVAYVSRSESEASLDTLNILEKERFMNGEKLVAIISEAASSGISLQADRRAINQRRRVHITLELPWSADRAVQQFGRTHRSNQVSAPQYIFMISDLAGERRFASTVARRLECLGALTHGDRRANESQDLSRFNIDNKFGHSALRTVLRSITGEESPRTPMPTTFSDSSASFIEEARRGLTGVGIVVKDNPAVASWRMDERTDISKFLNRILGLEVDLQNALFDYFTRTLQEIILASKQSGSFDMGILDLGLGPGEYVRKLQDRSHSFVIKSATGTYSVDVNCFGVERGMTWTQGVNVWREHNGEDDGFYLSKTPSVSGRFSAVLAVAVASKKSETAGEKTFQLYKASTGLQSKLETVSEMKRKYKKVYADTAEPLWKNHYEMSSVQCSHRYWTGGCQKAAKGLRCEIGLRTRTYHVLSGSVLSVWGTVESIINSTGLQRTMQLIRLRTEDQKRIVGCLIPNNVVQNLTYHLKRLEKSAENSSSNAHASSSSYTPQPASVRALPATTQPPVNFTVPRVPSPSNKPSTITLSDDDDDDDPDEVELLGLMGSGRKTLDLFM